MSLNVNPEWLLRMAEAEANGIVSVGGLVSRIRAAEARLDAGEGAGPVPADLRWEMEREQPEGYRGTEG